MLEIKKTDVIRDAITTYGNAAQVDMAIEEMSESVLLSIHPKWCELIASGKKTVEVRKNKPKLDTPFKCYIYCTKDKNKIFWYNRLYRYIDERSHNLFDKPLNGKVIGEFVCDFIEIIDVYKTDEGYDTPDCVSEYMLRDACLTLSQAYDYANGKPLYGWHISDLVIYDKPKELGEFKKINRECWYADLGLAKRDCPECQHKECFISRPPQSWCYVEE